MNEKLVKSPVVTDVRVVLGGNMKKESTLQIYLLYGLTILILLFGIYFIAFKTRINTEFSLIMPSSSMMPTIHPGSRVLFAHQKMVNRGDVVAYYPNNNDKSMIFLSRIVGLPGENIIIFERGVYVDGQFVKFEDIRRISKDEIPNDKSFDYEATSHKVINIPNDSYFVICDNYSNSVDSRKFGPINSDRIVGVMK